MADYSPPEVFYEILLRLPTKSICRFRAVCKSWNSIISTKPFIHSHLNHNLNSDINNHLLLKIVDEYHNNEHFLFRHYSLASPSLFPTPFLSNKSATYSILGICHGLICLIKQRAPDSPTSRIALWNPSIRKYVILPNPTVEVRFPGYFAIGFGSDSKNNDYKVVRVVYHVKGQVSSGVEVEVFSLRTGRWKMVEGVDLNCFIPAPIVGGHACMNDRAHWIGWQKDGKPQSLIMSFHMHDEVFRELSLPLGLEWECSLDLRVSVSRGCLAVIKFVANKQVYFKLWEMKDYGVPESWTLMYNVEDLHTSFQANRFSKSDSILVQTSPTTWGIYDPQNGRMMELQFSELGSFISVEKCQESLVLLDH